VGANPQPADVQECVAESAGRDTAEGLVRRYLEIGKAEMLSLTGIIVWNSGGIRSGKGGKKSRGLLTANRAQAGVMIARKITV